jgi:hypothetical protein
VNDALRAAGSSGWQSEELANKVEEPDDINSVHLGKVLGGGVLSWFEADIAIVCGTGDEDVDLTNRLDDLTYARKVGLRGGVSLDLGVGVGLLERLFGSSKN